ncbi:DNA alkylation repair protein [Actinokineospora sp. PR83]|uniref:DNA alkylation repair protein n=1 Tax=Actinokineospora sp. PR83 TaxID=2884908 RepID=UPI001F2C5CDA|nr:DNA alkylation repair protein [Actinokineospora sp. PR83]MCG8914289.1 DNA alkylation repair protein [Actinokineospora sp. PR83]
MPFADELIGTPTARALTTAIRAAAPTARLTALRAAPGRFDALSLRERSDLLRDALLADLPGDYATFAATIRAARDGDEPFAGWLIWPVTSAVAAKAVAERTDTAFDDALALLAELTPRLTSEFALRPLLDHHPDRALATITTWTTSPDPHVRRLASEGTRPFLPWARRVPALLARPGITLPILHALHRDDSEYVRRSVANHLNDLSRDHPDLVVDTAAGWLAEPDGNTPALVRHALRTLVKRGHPEALRLLGFAPVDVDTTGPELSASSVPFGGTITFRASIVNTEPTPVRIAVDYTVHHRKANGGQTGKTFKLTTRTLAPGERLDITRDHSFRPITTRRYHPGEHGLELHVNGNSTGRADFTLLPPRET